MTQPDIIVIGGGIAGTSAAAMLASGARVVLIEAEQQLGYHSTGRSAAIFIRNYGNTVLRALNAASAPVLLAPDGISDRSLLSPRGQLLIASENETDALEDYAKGAIGLESLTATEATALVPILRQERIAAAIVEWDAQDIDVDRMLQGYARLLRDRGGQTVTGAAVTGMTRADNCWHVSTATGKWSAPIVVNAAGAWADTVARMAGLASIKDWPLFGSASESWYAKPDAGRLLVSPADEDPVEPHDAWPDDMVLAEGLDRFGQAVSIPITRPTHSWAGLRSFMADRTPAVGFDPSATGFFWLAGQGGYGVQTAPALAAICAALCLGGQLPVAQNILDALSPDRFRTT
jgi:D-arginine dehydrogenase